MQTKHASIEWRHVMLHYGSLCSIMVEFRTICYIKVHTQSLRALQKKKQPIGESGQKRIMSLTVWLEKKHSKAVVKQLANNLSKIKGSFTDYTIIIGHENITL